MFFGQVSSEGNLSVLDEVESVSALNNGINPWVEPGKGAGVVLELLAGLIVRVKVVSRGVEEVSTKTIVSVEEDSVGIVVELSRNILNEELELVDGIGVALSTLEGRGLLGLLVVALGPLLNIGGLNLGNVELSAEGILVLDVLISLNVVEEILEWVNRETGVLLVDLSNDGGIDTCKGSPIDLLIRNLASDFLGKLGSSREGKDVGIVAEEEDLLGGWGLVVGNWSDTDHISCSDMRELELKSENVPGVLAWGSISESELVGVLIELEDMANLSNNIEVTLVSACLVETNTEIVGDHVVLAEVAWGPLAEVGKNSCLALVEWGVLSRVTDSKILIGVTSEGSPWAIVENVGIELSLAVVEAKGSSVDTNDVSEAGDDGEIFKSLGIEDEGSKVASISALLVEALINNLERADVSLVGSLVGEGGINDNTVDVLGLSRGKGCLAQLRVLVL